MRPRQIGQSPEADLLYQISKQLDRLIKIMGSMSTLTTTTTLP